MSSTMSRPIERRRQLHEWLREVFTALPAQLDPAGRTAKALDELSWAPAHPVIVAVGKAARAMAVGALSYMAERHLELSRGVLIAPAELLAQTRAGSSGNGGNGDGGNGDGGNAPLQICPSSHPVPDQASLAAAAMACQTVMQTPAQGGGILALISGGASALMCLPAPGLELADKVAATDAVYAAGADIRALNTVRKHLSAIKGGRLAELAPVPVTTLVLSDVVGDELSAVGSGPTVPDTTTFREACDCVAATVGWSGVSAKVRRVLEAGVAGKMPDTPAAPRPGDQGFLLAGTGTMLEAAEAIAGQRQAKTRIFARDLVGDVDEVARRICAQVRRLQAVGSPEQVCFIGGGEATIRLPANPGVGGRAQHVALTVARDMAGVLDIAVLVAGSDGVDGNSPAAGAVVDGHTWEAIIAAGLDPAAALARCDAYSVLSAVEATIVIGPTGINHADIVLIATGR